MNIVKVPLADVQPWDKNPRGIKTKDFERLKKQITDLGEYKPLVVFKKNGKYVVLGGNMRLKAYQDLGVKEVSISVVDAPTTAKQIKFALSDNDRAGYYEEDALAELVYPEIANLDLSEFKVDLGEAIDLKQVVERYGPDIDDGADDVPEIGDTPAVTKMGDMFTLGRHRLLCGDSTKAEDVARLMRGEKAGSVVTDPPYGIDAPNMTLGTGKKKFKRGDWDKERISIAPLLGVANQVVIWGGNYFTDELSPTNDWLCWHKKNDGLSFSEFELAWTNLGRNCRMFSHHWSGEEKAHPTQKPIAVISWCLGMTTGLCFDPFLGSGTTLIAAEKTGRVCYGMEIDPKYCDVIIKRYAGYTGTSEDAIRATREKLNGKKKSQAGR